MDVLQWSLPLDSLYLYLSLTLSLSLSANNCLLPSCHQTTLSHFTASLILWRPCQELTFNFHTSPSCYSFFFPFRTLHLSTAGGGADTTRAPNSNLSLWQGYLTCDVQCHLCTTLMLNAGKLFIHPHPSLSRPAFTHHWMTTLMKTLGGLCSLSNMHGSFFSPLDTPCYRSAASSSWWTQVCFSELEKQKESAAEARSCKASYETCKELIRFCAQRENCIWLSLLS